MVPGDEGEAVKGLFLFFSFFLGGGCQGGHFLVKKIEGILSCDQFFYVSGVGGRVKFWVENFFLLFHDSNRYEGFF